MNELATADPEAFCTLPELIHQHAMHAPDRVALHCGGDGYGRIRRFE